MAIDVKIPALGESITSGILANWRVQDGDTVKRDQPLYELETDKITSEGVAEADGVIHLKVEAGTEVQIGQVVATVEPGAAQPGGEKQAPAPAEKKSAATPAPEPGAAPPHSPAVRRIAEESGVDPATVAGTGKGGRVTKGDMLKAIASQAPAAPTPAAPEPAPVTKAPEQEPGPAAPAPEAASAPASAPAARPTRRRLSPLRAKIAQRLVQVKNETAMLTTFNEVDLTAVRELRARYQEDFSRRHGIKLGFMSFFVKAAVQALQDIPAVGAQLDGEELVAMTSSDIGVAVSTERGLMVPVLRDCANRSFAEIELALADYAKRAREGRITLADLSGGVFTITNGGVFGSLLSTPILNPPQSGILGMHAIQDRPVALGGQVVIRPMMYLALSYDHRIVDGKEAVTFLVRIKQAIEDPARLLLSV